MSGQRRILHVTTYVHPDSAGGAERVVHGLARAQARAGDDVLVLCGNHAGQPAREVIDGFQVERFPLPPGRRGARFLLAVAASCRRALAAHTGRPFDILHTHQVATAATALRLRDLARARVHSFYAPYHAEFAVEKGLDQARGAASAAARLRDRLACLAGRALDRRCLLLADRVVVLSCFSAEQARALAPSCGARLLLVPPGVDSERFRPAAGQDAGAPACWPAGVLRLLTVRRLVRRMGIDSAIAAAARLRAEGMKLVLAVAGSGPDRERLERQAGAFGLADTVRFLGHVPEQDLPHLYRTADLFLLPTRALEGFGLATLEALACGTPVLGTRVGATAELLARFTPEIEPVGATSAELAAGIRAASRDLPAWRAAARRAAERIARECTWEAVCARLESAYGPVPAARSASP